MFVKVQKITEKNLGGNFLVWESKKIIMKMAGKISRFYNFFTFSLKELFPPKTQ